MRARILVPLAVLAVAGVAAATIATRPGADLAAEFERRLAELPPGREGAPLTEADIAHLPAPVQCYLRRSGALGKPPVTMVHTTFEATLYNAPGAPGMSGPAHQVDVLHPLRRLFLMTTRMYGLPVTVLHDDRPEAAMMRVRAARLVDVVNVSGADLARTETVTFLNDLCVFAPSLLVQPQFQWTSVDDAHAAVSSTAGPHTVSATLVFNEEGDLVDLVSDDRDGLQPDGSLKVLRWTTPLSDHGEFEGRRVATHGDAIWHREDGPFTYGKFTIRDVILNGKRQG